MLLVIDYLGINKNIIQPTKCEMCFVIILIGLPDQTLLAEIGDKVDDKN